MYILEEKDRCPQTRPNTHKYQGECLNNCDFSYDFKATKSNPKALQIFYFTAVMNVIKYFLVERWRAIFCLNLLHLIPKFYINIIPELQERSYIWYRAICIHLIHFLCVDLKVEIFEEE